MHCRGGTGNRCLRARAAVWTGGRIGACVQRAESDERAWPTEVSRHLSVTHLRVAIVRAYFDLCNNAPSLRLRTFRFSVAIPPPPSRGCPRRRNAPTRPRRCSAAQRPPRSRTQSARPEKAPCRAPSGGRAPPRSARKLADISMPGTHRWCSWPVPGTFRRTILLGGGRGLSPPRVPGDAVDALRRTVSPATTAGGAAFRLRAVEPRPATHRGPRASRWNRDGGTGARQRPATARHADDVRPTGLSPVGWCGWASLGSCGPISSTVLPWPER